MTAMKLHDIAIARSGDKGNRATLSVIALDPAHYPRLERLLTEQRAAHYHWVSCAARCSAIRCRSCTRCTSCSTTRSGGGSRAHWRSTRTAKTLTSAILDMESASTEPWRRPVADKPAQSATSHPLETTRAHHRTRPPPRPLAAATAFRGRTRQGLPDQTDPRRGPVRGGRDRPDRPRVRREDVGHARPAGRRRQQARRQRQCSAPTSSPRRRPDGYTILIGTNSTNAALKYLMKKFDQDTAFAPVGYDRSVPLMVASTSTCQARRSGSSSTSPSPSPAGELCLRQHLAAGVVRDARQHGRDPDERDPLQERPERDDRPDRRPGDDVHRRLRGHRAAAQGRARSAAWRSPRPSARRPCPSCRRSTRPSASGLRADRLLRRLRAGGHAAGRDAKLNRAINDAANSKDVQGEVRAERFSVEPGTPEALAQRNKVETAKWGEGDPRREDRGSVGRDGRRAGRRPGRAQACSPRIRKHADAPHSVRPCAGTAARPAQACSPRIRKNMRMPLAGVRPCAGTAARPAQASCTTRRAAQHAGGAQLGDELVAPAFDVAAQAPEALHARRISAAPASQARSSGSGCDRSSRWNLSSTLAAWRSGAPARHETRRGATALAQGAGRRGTAPVAGQHHRTGRRSIRSNTAATSSYARPRVRGRRRRSRSPTTRRPRSARRARRQQDHQSGSCPGAANTSRRSRRSLASHWARVSALRRSAAPSDSS